MEETYNLCFFPEIECLRAENQFLLKFDFEILFSSGVRRKNKFFEAERCQRNDTKGGSLLMTSARIKTLHVGNGLKI